MEGGLAGNKKEGEWRREVAASVFLLENPVDGEAWWATVQGVTKWDLSLGDNLEGTGYVGFLRTDHPLFSVCLLSIEKKKKKGREESS